MNESELNKFFLNEFKKGNNCYVHKRKGGFYEILAFVEDCTNAREGELLVRYNRIENPYKFDFVRTIPEFNEKFAQIKPVDVAKFIQNKSKESDNEQS